LYNNNFSKSLVKFYFAWLKKPYPQDGWSAIIVFVNEYGYLPHPFIDVWIRILPHPIYGALGFRYYIHFSFSNTNVSWFRLSTTSFYRLACWFRAPSSGSFILQFFSMPEAEIIACKTSRFRFSNQVTGHIAKTWYLAETGSHAPALVSLSLAVADN
jgi:hypothetical protein